MHRILVVLVAATLLGTTGLAMAQEGTVQQGFLKSSVAEFDEPDRTKLLAFLAECRKVSDATAKAIAANDLTDASKVASPEAVLQWRAIAEQLNEVRKQSPSITLQYRNQALELVGPKEVPTSRVWYALVAIPASEAKNFVAIVVEQTPTGHAGRVIAIQPLGYSTEVPAWLQHVDAPAKPSQ